MGCAVCLHRLRCNGSAVQTLNVAPHFDSPLQQLMPTVPATSAKSTYRRSRRTNSRGCSRARAKNVFSRRTASAALGRKTPSTKRHTPCPLLYVRLMDSNGRWNRFATSAPMLSSKQLLPVPGQPVAMSRGTLGWSVSSLALRATAAFMQWTMVSTAWSRATSMYGALARIGTRCRGAPRNAQRRALAVSNRTALANRQNASSGQCRRHGSCSSSQSRKSCVGNDVVVGHDGNSYSNCVQNAWASTV